MSLQGFDGKIGTPIPSHKPLAHVALAMALGITKEQIEILPQLLKHGLVYQPAKSIAVHEMHQRPRHRLTMQPSQGQGRSNLMLPRNQLFNHDGSFATTSLTWKAG